MLATNTSKAPRRTGRLTRYAPRPRACSARRGLASFAVAERLLTVVTLPLRLAFLHPQPRDRTAPTLPHDRHAPPERSVSAGAIVSGPFPRWRALTRRPSRVSGANESSGEACGRCRRGAVLIEPREQDVPGAVTEDDHEQDVHRRPEREERESHTRNRENRTYNISAASSGERSPEATARSTSSESSSGFSTAISSSVTFSESPVSSAVSTPSASAVSFLTR